MNAHGRDAFRKTVVFACPINGFIMAAIGREHDSGSTALMENT
jgi:hypothetical protein